MLFRFALAVFKSTEEELLKCNDHMSIFNFLRQMPEKITDANTLSQVNIVCYYVAESASEQDKANPVFWLAPRAGKMGPCSPLGISRFDSTSNKGLFRNVIILYWPTRRSRWLNIGSFVSAFLLISTSFRSIKTPQKELGQYPVIFTSPLVNNPCA